MQQRRLLYTIAVFGYGGHYGGYEEKQAAGSDN